LSRFLFHSKVALASFCFQAVLFLIILHDLERLRNKEETIMKKAAFACILVIFAAALLWAEQGSGLHSETLQEPGQGMMTEGGQMPAMQQMKQHEMMIQDMIRVMADIVQVQRRIVERTKTTGKRDLMLEITDLTARVNTLMAGVKGLNSKRIAADRATGGSGYEGLRKGQGEISAPKIQEKTEADVSVSVSLESSNAVLVFRVGLASDTEDLGQSRFSESVLLRATGGREFQPRVRSEEGLANRRSAIIEFDNPGTKEYELVVRNIAGVPERIFPFPF
jgi:hypothetical protein